MNKWKRGSVSCSDPAAVSTRVETGPRRFRLDDSPGWGPLVWAAVWAVIMLLAATTRAQEPPQNCAELRTQAEGQPAPTRLPGPAQEPGMWFSMPTARLVLCEIEELRALREVVRASERELTLWERQVDFLGEQIATIRQARDDLDGVVTAAERRAQDSELGRLMAEEKLDAWHRSPILWVAVGVVTAVVLQVAAVLVLARVRD